MTTIPRIFVRGRITNPNAPNLDAIDYDKLIGGHANVTDWFTAKPSKTVLSSGIVSISSRKAGSSQTLATPGAPQAKPVWTAEDADFNGRPSVTHSAAGSGSRIDYDGAFPVAGDFFKVCIVDFVASPSGTQYLLSSDNTGNRHLLTVTSSLFSMRVGASGSNEAMASVAFRTGPVMVIGCWSGALKRARISLDLGATWVSDTKAAAVVDLTAVQMARNSAYKWTDCIFGNIDLSGEGDTAVTLLGHIAKYGREMVGVTT